MTEYIKSLLPRLQQFSISLDYVENFVEKPWIYLDDDGKRHVYIFQRDTSLIMSLNGQAQIGKWEYIAPASSLLIDRGKDKILLNQGFLDKAIMVLRTDGNFEKPWMLINEKEIPDLDVDKYIKQVLKSQLNLKPLGNGERQYYYADLENKGLHHNTEFYDEQLNKATFTLHLNENNFYEIQDGVVKNYYATLRFKTDRGIVDTISKSTTLAIDDSVSTNGLKAEDGMYKVFDDENYHHFIVQNGRIISIKMEQNYLPLLIIGLVAAIVIIYFAFVSKAL